MTLSSRWAALSLCLSLGFSTSAFAAPISIDRLEASINSELLLNSDLKDFRRTLSLRAQLDPLFSGTTVAKKGPSATDQEIVDFLINEKLITQQFPVSDSEVESEINSIQANNRIDRAGLRNALKEQGFSFDTYFELIRTGAAKRNLIDRDIRTKVTISDDDVKNYFYNRYAAATAVPSAYKVRIIVVSPSNYKSPNAARDVAMDALKAIDSGEAFEEVAKRISDDSSASSGGDLGVLASDQMNPVFLNQLKKMKIGEVSPVLGDAKTRFFVLKLEDIKSQQSERLEKMKEEIRAQLASVEYQRQIGLWLDRQRQLAFIHRAGASFMNEVPLDQK